MSVARRQALIGAPVAAIWDLVGNPARYPEWWPRVIEVRGERFEQGDEFVQITRRPDGRHPTTFAIDRLEGLREVAMTCQDTGAFSRWRLTAAGGGTFVEVEMGMLPETLTDRIFDRAVGRIYFRRWADQSLDALEAAAGPGAARGAE